MLGLRINVNRPVAEIFIIVVGVLIALGVDSWNDNRIDRVLEAQYLERLREDVRVNADIFGGAIEPEEAFNLKSARLKELGEMAGQPHDARLDLDYLKTLLPESAVLGWALPEYRTGTFEELKSTGNLGLIRDLDLRTALNDYDLYLRTTVVRINARMTDYPSYVYTLHPSFGDLSATRSGNLDVDSELDEELLSAIRTAEFRRLLNAETNYADWEKGVIAEFQVESEDLLSILEQALAE